jgi:hypothetical protein
MKQPEQKNNSRPKTSMSRSGQPVVEVKKEHIMGGSRNNVLLPNHSLIPID